jgi:hypothetical protein
VADSQANFDAVQEARFAALALGGMTEFVPWFDSFPACMDLEPTYLADPSDGKLEHLIGLNLSRAWMLEGILSTLRAHDGGRAQLSSLAGKPREAELSSITSERHEAPHRLGTCPDYVVNGRDVR